MVAHNANFDMSFIKTCQKAGYSVEPTIVDTVALTCIMFPKSEPF